MARQGQLLLRRAGGGRGPAERLAGEGRVVVFVHGLFAAGAVFDPMRERVERDLGLRTLDFTYGSLSTFESVAERFARHVEDEVADGVPVSLVGHSLGGLLSRWYVQEQGGAHRVDRVVTLATPHAGTRRACLAPTALGAVLRPESDLIRRLQTGRSRVAHLRHVAIVAGADAMCSPPASAGALDDAEVHTIDDLGHNALLFDPRVHDLVLAALR